LDGRDTDPKSGAGFIRRLQGAVQGQPVAIASVVGRYYAMDRDNRWERIQKAYDVMVNGTGTPATDLEQAILNSYENGITDEFVLTIVHTDEQGTPLATIEDGDVVICFNFRTDRGREITQALTQRPFPEQGMHPLDLR